MLLHLEFVCIIELLVSEVDTHEHDVDSVSECVLHVVLYLISVTCVVRWL